MEPLFAHDPARRPQRSAREADAATGRMHQPDRIGLGIEADLVHTARSRAGFARGALRAARWIVGKQGLYEFSAIWDQLQ